MKQIEDINSFADPQKEGLDSDTNDNFVPKGHSRYRLNCRSGSSGGSVGIVENVKGTVLCSYTFEETVEHTEIGSCDDAVNSHIYYFVAGGDEHYILRYSVELNSITLILRHALLNFSASYRIHNPAFIDGVLLWTDGNNPPRSLIVQNAINYTNGVPGGLTSYAAITEQVLDAIIYPPGFPPSIEYGDDYTKDVNNLRGGMWQFAYQYVYVDNAKSCWSPYSKVGKPVFDENVDGSYFENQKINNYIKIYLNTGTNEVKRINLATRENNIAEWTLIEGIEKYDEAGNVLIPHNIDYEYDFYNDFRGEPLDQVDFVRPFDYVPLKSKAQEVSDDERLIYGNNQEGYNNVEMDTEIELLDTYADAGLNSVKYLLVNHIPLTPSYNYQDPINYQVRCAFTPPLVNTIVEYRVYIYIYTTALNDSYYGTGGNFYKNQGTLLSHTLYLNTWQGHITSLTNITDILDDLKQSINNDIPYLVIRDGNELVFNVKGKNYIAGTTFTAKTYPLLRVRVQEVVTPELLKRTIFKQGAYHQLGIVYYDKSNRSGYTNVGTTQLGVYDPQKIYMPTVREIWGGWVNDNYPYKYPRYIIRHRPPVWATHYQIVHSGNQSINKFFTIAIPKYVVIVPPSPIYGWRYVADDDTIRIDINSLIIEQKGRVTNLNYGTYGFVPGDRARFLYGKASIISTQMEFIGNNIDVEILGYNDTTQEIMLPNFGLSKIDKWGLVTMEIYTPSKNKDEKTVFKEIGLCYEIGNPGQANAYHKGNNQDQDAADPIGTPAIVSLIDSGDTYVIGRIAIRATPYSPSASGAYIEKYPYLCESDSYSDYYPSNDYDFGRPNMVNKDAAQRWYKNHYRHGGRKYPMTNLNYLFKFDYDDFDSVNIDHGEITGLRQIGFTLKIIQQKKITSQYIGRTELLDNRGQSSLQKSDTVFGSKRPSEEDYGCYDPGSILANDRYLYFLDVSNGCVVRDAANGMVPISKYFLDNYWKEQCRLMSKEKGKYNVHTVFHRKYGELYMTIIPIGRWIEPMDSFTIHFHEESNRWKSFWSFLPEGYGITNNTMVSFVDGQLHVHEANSLYNNFYGTQYKMILDLYSNEYPKNVKAYQSLAVHANRSFYCPNTGDILILPTENYPNGMISRLTENNFQPMEGVWFSSLLNDMSDPRFASQLEALFHGRDLRGRAIKIKLTSDGHLETKLDFVTINSVISES